MKTRPCLRSLVTLFGLTVWVGVKLSLAQTSAPPGQPVITDIQLDKAKVTISAKVPAGLKRLILQSSQRLGTGAWEPRAVIRVDGQGGTVTFQVPRSTLFELVRIRGDQDDPLPIAFYTGTNRFSGIPLQSTTTPPEGTVGGGGGVVITGSPVGVVDNRSVPAANQPTDPARTVVESDIWSVQGNVLYFFNQYRGLQVIDLSNPDAPVIRGTLSLPALGEQMYVLADQTVVLLASDDCSGSANSSSQVLVVNANGASPQVMSRLPVPGQIQESRLVGTALYVMSQRYTQTSDSKDGSWEWGTTVSAFDLSTPSAPVARPSMWYAGGGNVVSATDQYLFVSLGSPDGTSLVNAIDISAPDGTLQKAFSINVAGSIPDKFKMSLSGDVFTTISVKWASQPNGRSSPVTVLETFSLANPTSPQKLGELKLAEGEQLHATRFDGNRVYVVTFFQTDPLWIVDLSDPAHPAIAGELKVPGWSTYIQPYGDRLVSIGIDNANGWKVAVSLFDVHDSAAPNLISRIPLGNNYSWSEATDDEKAFGFLPDAGLILVPYTSFSTNNVQGVQLIDYSPSGLAKRGFISQNMQARRSTLAQGRILSISGTELLTVDASDRDHPAVQSTTELAWSVDRVFVQGDYLLQLQTADPSGNGAGPIVRVTPSASPEKVLNALVMTNLPIVGATARDGRLYLLQGLTTYPGPIIYANGTGTSLPGTNQTVLVCSILDLSQLPQMNVVSSITLTNSDPINGNATAVWPKPDLLVWVTQQLTFLPLRWGMMPGVDVIAAGAATPAGSGSGVVGRPIWFPYGSYGDSQLLALDLKNPQAPQFISQVNLTSTNGWSSYSQPFTADNGVYLSQLYSESSITDTNIFVTTNLTYTVGTNVVVVTNYTKVPVETVETNSLIVTNVSLVAIKNLLGNQPVMTIGAANPLAQVISGGSYHSLALAADGEVWAWGGNPDGQLGDPLSSDRPQPGLVAGLDGVVSITSGNLHNLALKADGTVWAWGNDSFGQLGDGTPPQDPNTPPLPQLGGPTPVPALGLDHITAIGAGSFHNLAVKTDGTVWAWGGNWAGQLGDGTFTSQSVPMPVAGLSDVIQVGAGQAHSLALKKDGTVWAWGANDHGQLGDPNLLGRTAPGQVGSLSGVIAVACGQAHSLALKQDGTVWAWGQNEAGQLGDGTQADHAQPALVSDLTDVMAVACGHSHSLALKRDGTVWGWGRNLEGEIGDSTGKGSLNPVLVQQVPSSVALAAGESHSLAVSSDGAVFAWGNNERGQLGSGETLNMTNVFTKVYTVTNLTWVVETEVGLATNYVKVPQTTLVTNLQPVYTWRQVYTLHVIDFTAPAAPVLRQPVALPGSLQGISPDGSLVYAVGYHVTDNPKDATDGTEWLHALSYDGVACYLVDSHPLQQWPHPVLVQGANLFIARPEVDQSNPRALEIWSLSGAAKFTKLGERPLASNANSFFTSSDLFVAQEDAGAELFDLTNPTTLPVVGQDSPSGCMGWNLGQGVGSLQDGFWVPLGLYGTQKIDVKR